ncbi:MAG TPA: endonuclease V [bacterium]|nr:endonuclease V [bacterium]
MKPYFPKDVKKALALQRELACHVKFTAKPRRIRRIAGVDVAYHRGLSLNVGAVVILSYPDLETEEVFCREAPTPFPYVPSLLSFREAPLCFDILKSLKGKIDVLLVDGQGIAHPRRFGIASHLGVLLDIPTIGCAKSRLVGDEPKRLGQKKGAREALNHNGERVGTVLRTRTGVKPVYVSVGHRCRLEWAEELILELTPCFRIPEPISRAHNVVTKKRLRMNIETT